MVQFQRSAAGSSEGHVLLFHYESFHFLQDSPALPQFARFLGPHLRNEGFLRRGVLWKHGDCAVRLSPSRRGSLRFVLIHIPGCCSVRVTCSSRKKHSGCRRIAPDRGPFLKKARRNGFLKIISCLDIMYSSSALRARRGGSDSWILSQFASDLIFAGSNIDSVIYIHRAQPDQG